MPAKKLRAWLLAAGTTVITACTSQSGPAAADQSIDQSSLGSSSSSSAPVGTHITDAEFVDGFPDCQPSGGLTRVRDLAIGATAFTVGDEGDAPTSQVKGDVFTIKIKRVSGTQLLDVDTNSQVSISSSEHPVALVPEGGFYDGPQGPSSDSAAAFTLNNFKEGQSIFISQQSLGVDSSGRLLVSKDARATDGNYYPESLTNFSPVKATIIGGTVVIDATQGQLFSKPGRATSTTNTMPAAIASPSGEQLRTMPTYMIQRTIADMAVGETCGVDRSALVNTSSDILSLLKNAAVTGIDTRHPDPNDCIQNCNIEDLVVKKLASGYQLISTGSIEEIRDNPNWAEADAKKMFLKGLRDQCPTTTTEATVPVSAVSVQLPGMTQATTISQGLPNEVLALSC